VTVCWLLSSLCKLRLLSSPTVKGHITAGALVGKMPTQKCWSWPVTTKPSRRAGKTTTPIRGVCSSTPESPQRLGCPLSSGLTTSICLPTRHLSIKNLMLSGPSSVNGYGIGDLLPVTFLIDRTGKIQAVQEGFGKKDEFESTIEKLLAAK
jgi:hypothetical protein